MEELYQSLPQDNEDIDGYYKKVASFYNSLNEKEKEIFHTRASKARETIDTHAPDISNIFSDPGKKAELETYLKEKAGINDVPEDKDILDSGLF
ncbi:hypothetical protein [Eilatimonas milleporae]|uniref:Uncharacterized protein n=1 Tax=Eilatimonas milleporae TaxID=911205 RepID=A0A3M0C6E4_9PROT|nr:hypothetical protein [Eilatimonas milleporae]RMB04812.1 hypothetical protein BXY39_2378 [Eilatimonas milleporae]